MSIEFVFVAIASAWTIGTLLSIATHTLNDKIINIEYSKVGAGVSLILWLISLLVFLGK